ncbi:hypothetical protein J6590_012666 [Homalodisca vitripennis]|nr:hypothetical protein J6590_012666 [Homalodisca vitripennis]
MTPEVRKQPLLISKGTSSVARLVQQQRQYGSMYSNIRLCRNSHSQSPKVQVQLPDWCSNVSTKQPLLISKGTSSVARLVQQQRQYGSTYSNIRLCRNRRSQSPKVQVQLPDWCSNVSEFHKALSGNTETAIPKPKRYKCSCQDGAATKLVLELPFLIPRGTSEVTRLMQQQRQYSMYSNIRHCTNRHPDPKRHKCSCQAGAATVQ